MITVVVTRTVKPGCEAAFEAALHAFLQRSFAAPGQLGVHVIRPAPGSGSREYGILRRFASDGDVDAFYASQLFADWEVEVASVSEGTPRPERVIGLETWFTAPGRPIVPPPRWKMALVTFAGVYPVSLAVSGLLRPLMGGWRDWQAALPISAGIVVCLTWAVMPILARLLHPWLAVRKEPPREHR